MAQPAHLHNHATTTTTHHKDTTHHGDNSNIAHASKMHGTADKLVGGIKETIGTIAHAESLKEAGREQKREGDAETLAATKGKKHYDPALSRKGLGIQHKHMGPNPKKHTEGPCAGCKEGTCQIGHDYDAAICHSVTQGHADAGHVKHAGLGHDPALMHGDGVMHSGACCSNAACSTAVPCTQCNSRGIATHPVVTTTHPVVTTTHPVVMTTHDTHHAHGTHSHSAAHAHDAHHAHGTHSHSAAHARDAHSHNAAHSHSAAHANSTTVKKTKHKNRDKKLKRRAEKAEMDRAVHRASPDFKRDLEGEHRRDKVSVAELDLQDQRDMKKLHPQLHRCDHSEYKRKHKVNETNYMTVNNGVHYCDVCNENIRW